jgi:hypothetical protein
MQPDVTRMARERRIVSYASVNRRSSRTGGENVTNVQQSVKRLINARQLPANRMAPDLSTG